MKMLKIELNKRVKQNKQNHLTTTKKKSLRSEKKNRKSVVWIVKEIILRILIE
jgi:hypothetical protein